MSGVAPAMDRRQLLQHALRSIDELQARLDAIEQRQSEPIAIVGLGCRFPGGAAGPAAYWQLLQDGRDAIRAMPAERRRSFATLPDVMAAFDQQQWYGGFLDEIDRFDAAFFGISPREALALDPQQRLVLEVAWEALEQAGQAPDQLSGSATGVFIGVTTSDYSQLSRQGGADQLDVYTATGGTLNAVAGRLAYTLGLQGPAMAIDTACSSSLVAIHQACQSLRTGESSMALAGGVNVALLPESYLCCLRWGMLATDGRCKAFDARADGFVRSEGCGIVVLKRLSDAQANGDPILALIRGSAVNQDGRSSGLTVPNGLAQQRVIRQALASARLRPADIAYVEAHGAGTALGDPIEVEALSAVLGEGRRSDQPLVVGSVKTNLGHCEAAAGVAGLIKVVLALHHQTIPAHLHLTERSHQIAWPAFPLIIPDRAMPWPTATGARYAGISGFGLSGTNAHVILAEPPPSPPAAPYPQRSAHLLCLSARTPTALQTLAGHYRSAIDGLADDRSLADLCATVNSGRAHLSHRLAIVTHSPDELRAQLTDYRAAGEPLGLQQGQRVGSTRPRLAFLFTGHGAQYDDMARQLYVHEPVFRDAFDTCATLLQATLDRPLAAVLYPAADSAIGDEAALRATMTYGLPALFAIQYGLIQLWRAWGVEPNLVLGHSAGEYAAAHLAGVFSLDDALTLVAARGRLMQSLPMAGAMVVVLADPAQVAEAIAPCAATVAIAAINGPQSVVISGLERDIQSILADLTAQAIEWRRLPIAQGSHSPLVEPVLDEFERIAATVTYHEPRLPLISCRTGRPVQAGEITSPTYWRSHLRQPVLFADAIGAAHTHGASHYLELGPHPTLLGMGRGCLPDGAGTWLPSLRQGRAAWDQLFESLGTLYVDGLTPSWRGLDHGQRRPPVTLPTYPFERETFWLIPPATTSLSALTPAPSATATQRPHHPLLGARLHSPALREIVYEAQLGATQPAYLNDHRVHGLAILPGVAYLELALAAADQLGRGAGRRRSQTVRIDELVIREPLILPEEGTGRLQVTLAASSPERATVQIYWQAPVTNPAATDEPIWSLKATAELHLDDHPSLSPRPIDVSILADADRPAIAVTSLYERLTAIGLHYGPRFRGVQRLSGGPGEVWAWIALPAAERAGAEQHWLHPALLDACVQTIGAALPATDATDSFYMPVAIDGVRLVQRSVAAVWCHVTVALTDEAMPVETTASLRLYDETGQPVAEIDQLTIRRTSQAALARLIDRPADDLLYRVTWQDCPLTTDRDDDRPRLAGPWLILTDRQGVGASLAALLAEQGATAFQVAVGPDFALTAPNHWRVNPRQPDDLHQALAAVMTLAAGPLRGVIVLWALDGTIAEAIVEVADLEPTAWLTGGLLHLTQALDAQGITGWPPLWLVTRGGTTVSELDEPPAIDQSVFWGLGPSLTQELPALRCTMIDLDPLNDAAIGHLLLAELTADDREDRIAWRGHQRMAQRLVPDRPAAPATPPRAVELTLTERGLLETLQPTPQTRPEPGPGEVVIAVQATGMNFRDVLNALGVLPGNADAFGLECSGIVVATGPDVTEPRIGQAVVAIAGQSYRSFVVTPASLTVPKPTQLSHIEAATIPIAFLTAQYGLNDLAQLQPGDRILIHAGAGGVGLAAIQLAQRAGAQIFATAGSERKRRYLRSIGVPHVLGSRTTDFAAQILALTEGAGVDIVLNSLTDEFIPASLAALRSGGCFLELGRRGTWDEQQMARTRPDVRYRPYELGTLLTEQPTRLQILLTELMDAMERRELRPLPHRCFPIDAAPAAFQYMAQARHIGKVVIQLPPLPPVDRRPARALDALCHEQASYLVTGGLGGLGLTVATWLVEQGARHLVLVGRRAPTPAAEATLASLRANGVTIETIAADIADAQQVATLFAHIDRTLPPLRGLIHSAAVLDDGLALTQTWARSQRVLAPKIAGSWLLHQATASRALDFFVLFSSASAVLGSPGQTVYTAGNAFQDSLAHWRASRGLPATSIGWGAWGDVGLAAGLAEREHQRWAEAGIGFFTPHEGLQALGLAIRHRLTRLTVVRVDWSRRFAATPPEQRPPLYAALIAPSPSAGPSAEATGTEPAFGDRLRTTSAPERRTLITARLREQVARVLRVARPEQLQSTQSLSDYGLDSLMAVELRNRLQADLAISLPLRSLLGGSTIAGLAEQIDHLVAEHQPAPTTGEAPHDETLSAQEAERLLADLDQLSDDQVAGLLTTILSTSKESA